MMVLVVVGLAGFVAGVLVEFLVAYALLRKISHRADVVVKVAADVESMAADVESMADYFDRTKNEKQRTLQRLGHPPAPRSGAS
jgi:MFS superfamily sulfate permease-like transporter